MADPYIAKDPKTIAASPSLATSYAPTTRTGGGLARQVGQQFDTATGKYKDTATMGQAAPETAAGQMQMLLAKQSPWMKQAETQGLQQAAKRGLLSSSMAVGAVEAERIRAAAPLAEATARQYAQQAALNQDIMAKYGLASQAGEIQRSQAALENAIKQQQFRMQGGVEKELVGARGAEERLGITTRGAEERLGIEARGGEERLGITARGTEERLGIGARGEEERLGIEFRGLEERLTTQQRGLEERAAVAARGEEERATVGVKGAEERTTIGTRGAEERKSIAEKAVQEKSLISTRATEEKGLITAKTAAETPLIGERKAADIAKEQAASAESIRRMGFDVSGKLEGTFTEAMRNTIDRAAQEMTKVETSDQLNAESKKNIVEAILAQRNNDLSFLSDLYKNLPAWQPTWINKPLTGKAPPAGTAIAGPPAVTPKKTTPTKFSK